MTTRRQRAALEQEVHSEWRKLLGISPKNKRMAKRSHNKRVRREGKENQDGTLSI